jgi:glycosyl transferase family 25
MEIYYINLDHRTDRNEHVLKQIASIGCKVIRIDAVECKQGAIGCGMSHIRCLELAKEQKLPFVCIVEDDIEFTDLVSDMDDFFKLLPEDWDMLYFGGNHNTHMGVNPPIIINEKVSKLHNTYSTHCVAINKKSFLKIHDRLKKCNNALDVIYVELQNILNVYSFYPMIATQRVSFSDIEDRITDYKWLIK